MVSSTQQTERRRRIRKRRAGRDNTKERLKRGTPPFPIHPEQSSQPGAGEPKAKDAKNAG
jgi:hypothetical protein